MIKPLVSVVIPTYNRSFQLTEAIDSVQNQSFTDWELIIIDDGSEENTEDIIPKDHRITYKRISHTGLPGKVRNEGVRLTNANWIAFLDSDDIWSPDKLITQMNYLRTHLDCKIVHTRETWQRNNKIISQRKMKHKREGDIFEDSLDKCIIGPSTVLLSRELYLALGGFDESIEIAEDYEFWLRITAKYEVGYIDEPLVIKKAGDWEQLSTKYGQIEIFRIKALQGLIDRQYFNRTHDKLARKVMAYKCRIYGKGALKRGHQDTYKKYMSLASSYSEEGLV
ncbi:glycosyltransferase family 2 protein [Spirochaeta cellobiosiphila]|uniref:glycosyltransferase family 2 protein n=1 Tax=Spirochaeta cellobiosiphila TaxID=504483 RepID=UPI0004269D03|nr:glycosyltransferase [Spirochaeta cellobiosiphila]